MEIPSPARSRPWKSKVNSRIMIFYLIFSRQGRIWASRYDREVSNGTALVTRLPNMDHLANPTHIPPLFFF